MNPTERTVRDHLNRKIVPAFGLILVCFVFFALIGVVKAARQDLHGLPFFPFLGVIAGILYLSYGIRCPNCGGSIGHLPFLPGGGYVRFSRKLRFCPFCGVGLDRELESLGEEPADGVT